MQAATATAAGRPSAAFPHQRSSAAASPGLTSAVKTKEAAFLHGAGDVSGSSGKAPVTATERICSVGYLSLRDGRLPGPVCQLLNIICASRIETIKCEVKSPFLFILKGLARGQLGRGLEKTPALVGTQSSFHLSPQTCSHFQNALNLIFEYYHPSFQQCCKPRAVLQKMPGPARVFHLCLGHVAPARLPTSGMCSGSPCTSLLLVPQLDKSVEASCSLGAGEHLGRALLQLKLRRSDNICRQEQGT